MVARGKRLEREVREHVGQSRGHPPVVVGVAAPPEGEVEGVYLQLLRNCIDPVAERDPQVRLRVLCGKNRSRQQNDLEAARHGAEAYCGSRYTTAAAPLRRGSPAAPARPTQLTPPK